MRHSTKLSPSDQAVYRKWTKAVFAFYTTLIVIGAVFVYAVSPRPPAASVTAGAARGKPASVNQPVSRGFVSFVYN